jgi:hypothetical protein
VKLTVPRTARIVDQDLAHASSPRPTFIGHKVDWSYYASAAVLTREYGTRKSI